MQMNWHIHFCALIFYAGNLHLNFYNNTALRVQKRAGKPSTDFLSIGIVYALNTFGSNEIVSMV